MNQNNAQTQQEEQRKIAERLGSIENVILVLSGKGGVGKSSVAVNVATALASRGHSVGLLDIDFHGPSVPGMLGLGDENVIMHDNSMVPVEFTPNLKVMSIGFLTRNRTDAVIWRGPMKYGVIGQLLGDVEWGALDYLVIDSPPGTGDEPLSIAQMTAEKARALVVTTPQQVSVDDVVKCVTFCGKLNVPIVGIVENMSGFVCPECGARTEIFQSGGGERLAKETGVPFLGKIPLDPSVVISGDQGRPIILGGRGGETADAFDALAAAVE